MMGLDKPQQRAKFEVAGFIYDGNMREFVFKRQIRSEPPFGGLRGNVRISSIARWKARSRVPIRDNWTFFASSCSWDVISRHWSKSVLFRGGGSRWVQILGGRGRRPSTIVGIRKLECFATSQWREHDSIFILLGIIPACERQIDGWTQLLWLIQHSALQAMRPRCQNCYKKIPFRHGSYEEIIHLHLRLCER